MAFRESCVVDYSMENTEGKHTKASDVPDKKKPAQRNAVRLQYVLIAPPTKP